LALAALLVGVLSPAGAAATGSGGQKSSAPREVLAIVSPLALPACSAAGSATLLVPIVSGLLQDGLHLPKNVSVGDLLLNAIGPVFVVCGDLPASAGTRCSLDDQIAAVWPESLTAKSLSPPAPAGDLFDSLTAALQLLHLNALDAVKPALKCRVETAKAPPPAPPGLAPPAGPVAPVAVPSAGSLPASTTAQPGSANSAPTLPSVVTAPRPSSAPPQLAAPASVSPSLVSAVTRRLPSGVVAMQVALGLLLALVLAGAWLTSGRLSLIESRRRNGS
jgi:hypothetical protein